jgi:hypothetical protein
MSGTATTSMSAASRTRTLRCQVMDTTRSYAGCVCRTRQLPFEGATVGMSTAMPIA